MHSVVRENVARKAYSLMEKNKRQLRLNDNSVFIVPKNMDYFDFSPVHKVFSEDGTGKPASHFDTDAFHNGLLRVDFSENTDITVLRLFEFITGVKAKAIPLYDNSVFELLTAYADNVIIPDGLEGIGNAGVIREKGSRISSFEELIACLGSVSDALTTYRLMWFKKHYLPEFFAAVLSAFVDKTDKSVFFETKENCMRSFSKTECSATQTVNRIMYEIFENKISFSGFSLYDSEAFRFKVDKNNIIMPLYIISEMTQSAAQSIVCERKREEFQSVADLVARCGIEKKCVEAMRSHGLFDNLDENAQISMFSLLQ